MCFLHNAALKNTKPRHGFRAGALYPLPLRADRGFLERRDPGVGRIPHEDRLARDQDGRARKLHRAGQLRLLEHVRLVRLLEPDEQLRHRGALNKPGEFFGELDEHDHPRLGQVVRLGPLEVLVGEIDQLRQPLVTGGVLQNPGGHVRADGASARKKGQLHGPVKGRVFAQQLVAQSAVPAQGVRDNEHVAFAGPLDFDHGVVEQRPVLWAARVRLFGVGRNAGRGQQTDQQGEDEGSHGRTIYS